MSTSNMHGILCSGDVLPAAVHGVNPTSVCTIWSAPVVLLMVFTTVLMDPFRQALPSEVGTLSLALGVGSTSAAGNAVMQRISSKKESNFMLLICGVLWGSYESCRPTSVLIIRTLSPSI